MVPLLKISCQFACWKIFSRNIYVKEGGGAGGEPFFYITIFVLFVLWFPFSVLGFLLYCMYNIWQDSNPSCCNRSQVCYQWQWASHIPNELHTSLMSYTHNLLIIFCKTARGARCGFQFSTKIAELGKRNNCCAISHYRWTRCQTCCWLRCRVVRLLRRRLF